jgi:hypothetical protein
LIPQGPEVAKKLPEDEPLREKCLRVSGLSGHNLNYQVVAFFIVKDLPAFLKNENMFQGPEVAKYFRRTNRLGKNT